MAAYVTKRCPHCGSIYANKGSSSLREYGCPYITCFKCGKSFWDTDIKEPALYGFKNGYETRRSIKAIILILFTIPIGLGFCVGGIFSLRGNELWTGLGLVFIGGAYLYTVISYIAKQTKKRKNGDGILLEQRSSYDESMDRLNNNEYLSALAEHDRLAKKLFDARKAGNQQKYAPRP